MILKSIGVLSAGKILAALYVLVAFIVGGLFSLVSLAGFAAGGGQDGGAMALLFGAGAVVVLPVVYGVMGFVTGVIMAALYNLMAHFVGGIELELNPAPGYRMK